MLRIDVSEQSVFATYNYRVETPDGTMFVAVMEDAEKKFCAIDIQIGKAGSALKAWTHSFSRLMTMAIEHGVTLEELLTELSSQHSDKPRKNTSNGIVIMSGVDGVYNALMQYRADKFLDLKKAMGMDGKNMERRTRVRG